MHNITPDNTNLTVRSLFCYLCKPLQNQTGSRAPVRHWSALDATGTKAIQPASLQVSFPIANSKQMPPCRQWPSRRKHCPLTRTDQPALAEHHHVKALSTAATPRHPAGLQNDTMLLPCSCVSYFIFYKGGWGQFEFWFPACAYLGFWSVPGSLAVVVLATEDNSTQSLVP